MQKKIVRMGRAKQGQYQPQRNFGVDRNRGLEEPRPSRPCINLTNMVNEEEELWCIYCKALHVEESCP
jgi:hypothetical protein